MPTRNFYAIDLRDIDAFEAAHIDGTVALPIDWAILRSDDFIAIRDVPVVFIADNEMHARLTAVWQVRLGSTDVAVLAGGVAGWIAEGRAVASGRAPPLGWLQAQAAGQVVAAQDLVAWLASRPCARVLHVDTSATYRQGHLPGAIWLARSWIETRIDDVAPDPDAPLLLTCASGTQAPFAAATLRERGRADVAWLAGGLRVWAAAGGALATSALELQDDELVEPMARDEQAMRRYLDWAGSMRG